MLWNELAALVTADRNALEISMVLSTLRSEAACLPARPIESSRVLTSRTDAASDEVFALICIASASGVLIRGQPEGVSKRQRLGWRVAVRGHRGR